jgi:O-antigen/teichoic acid export membrane protein
MMFLAHWREGLHFSVGLASQTVYNDVDKVMLARLASDASAGVYASAYRAIDLACVPLRALFGAAYIRYFRAGTAGLQGTVRIARQLLVPSLAAAVASALLLLATAGLLPLLLGPEFERAVGITRWLALIPVLRALHYLPADSLTGAGMQGIRTVCQLGIAILNVALNLILIPAYGISGAVASSIATDALLACALWIVVARRLRPSVFVPAPRGGH